MIENDLGKDSIPKLVRRIAIPSMIAQFVSVLYSIVDRMYIGHIPEIGSLALAGVGICGPVLTMIASVASWIGIGGAPLMSIRLGEKNQAEARKILFHALWMLCAGSALLMLFIYPLTDPMLRLFGASDTTLPYARTYFMTYMAGTPFALLSVGMNQFVISQGYARTGMQSVLLGTVLNIALDPLFIFAFDMGVRGAAVATVISQLASCVFVLVFLFRPTIPVPITRCRPQARIAGRILLMGLTPFLIVAADNIMIIVMNAVLQHYGGAERGDMLITCATIVQSFMLLVTMPLGGITGGTQTILGYNYGAGQTDRVIRAQRHIIKFCLIFTSVMFLISQTMNPLFIRLFTNDSALTELTGQSIRIATLAVIPLGIQYELVDGFTAMGQAELALPLSFWRKIAYFGSLFIIPLFWDVQYVFFAEVVSDILGPLVSISVYLLVIRKILGRRTAYLARQNHTES